MGKNRTDRDVERLLRKAVGRSVPNVYEQVSGGAVPPLLNVDEIVPPTVSHRRGRLPVALLATLLLLLCVGALSYFHTAAILSIGEGPAVELSLNRYGRVLEVHSGSALGERILSGLELEHDTVDDALEHVADAMKRLDCLAQAQDIPIAVDGGSWKYNRELLAIAKEKLEEAVEESGGQASILPPPEETQQPVPTASQAGAAVPTAVPATVRPTAVAVPNVAPSPVPTATPPPTLSSRAEVGLERAKAAALAYAGVKEEAVRFTKTEREQEEDRIYYELEFLDAQASYECEVDAITGIVVSFERDVQEE